MDPTIHIPLLEPNSAGAARREALLLARRVGFSEEDAGRVGVAMTEAALNAVKHAHDGLALLNQIEPEGLEILVVDKGPGMEDVDRCMVDGFSTAGSPGTGLGALSRMSDRFEIYSQPGQGTAVMCHFRRKGTRRTNSQVVVGAICVPAQNESVCGDNWALRQEQGRTVLLVADGLGHGTFAGEAAAQAVKTFEKSAGLSPEALVLRLHGSLRSTRGASLAVAAVNHNAASVAYCGLGNISSSILEPNSSRSMVSHNGIVGHQLLRTHEFSYPWSPATSTLVLHSDGLSARWILKNYPGILRYHPSVLAAVLYRDFHRERDDATVVVLREAG
jgi:anti-sigma regulatory factor (Ser/Thr protein kinase)